MVEEKLLIPSKQYLKSGIHIGTKFQTKYMNQFIYKTRPDGLAVLNLQQIDERLKVLMNFLSQYAPEEILVVSRRENGWKPINMMTKLTGIRSYTGRYPPGILTNPDLKEYMEVKVLLVTDSWVDRNVINEAMRVGTPVVALCDTNNQTNKIDLVIPCNNKGKKSLGLLFYMLTKNYMKKRKMITKDSEFKATIDDFTQK